MNETVDGRQIGNKKTNENEYKHGKETIRVRENVSKHGC